MCVSKYITLNIRLLSTSSCLLDSFIKTEVANGMCTDWIGGVPMEPKERTFYPYYSLSWRVTTTRLIPFNDMYFM